MLLVFVWVSVLNRSEFRCWVGWVRCWLVLSFDVESIWVWCWIDLNFGVESVGCLPVWVWVFSGFGEQWWVGRCGFGECWWWAVEGFFLGFVVCGGWWWWVFFFWWWVAVSIWVLFLFFWVCGYGYLIGGMEFVAVGWLCVWWLIVVRVFGWFCGFGRWQV